MDPLAVLAATVAHRVGIAAAPPQAEPAPGPDDDRTPATTVD